MFESAASPIADEVSRAERIRELQGRIRGMQRTRLESRVLPTSAALAGLLPGGGIAAGGSYVVEGSTALALELLREPSRAGAWCAIVGVPDLGVEAVAAAGVELGRLVLVPHPGDQWSAVVSALVDAVAVVLVRPPRVVSEAVAGRLSARLQQREAVLLAMSPWPRAQARLSVAESEWVGVGQGFGHLAARRATVVSSSPVWRGGARSERIWLPDASGAVAALRPVSEEHGAGSAGTRGAIASRSA